MTILKNFPIPKTSRQVNSAFDGLEINDALLTPVADLGGDTDKARRRIQSRVGAASKRLSRKYSIRVITSPIDGVDVAVPAIGVWRTA